MKVLRPKKRCFWLNDMKKNLYKLMDFQTTMHMSLLSSSYPDMLSVEINSEDNSYCSLNSTSLRDS